MLVVCSKRTLFLTAAALTGLALSWPRDAAGARNLEQEQKIYESFFPDSNQAGERLDQWWKTKNTTPAGELEILEIIKQGFRRTSKSRPMIVAWLGRYLAHPDRLVRTTATAILYHATFCPEGHVRHFAVYYGLSTIQDKSPQVLERLACLAMSNESVNRIVWGIKLSRQQEQFAQHIEPYLSSPLPELRQRAEELSKLLAEDMESQQQWRSAVGQTTAEPNDIDNKAAFRDLYEVLGKAYGCFELKGIDWHAVGREFLPRAEHIQTDRELALLCVELLARLQDSHAYLMSGTLPLPEIGPEPWDAGFSCLEDDRGRPAVYYIDPGGPAERAGVKLGMVVLKVDRRDANDLVAETMAELSKYAGYSSRRLLRYHAYHFFTRQRQKGRVRRFLMLAPDGKLRTFKLAAELGPRYLPRLPVPKDGIPDYRNVSWKMLDASIGYIYVRRIRQDLIQSLDRAVEELSDAAALVVDVRGNSGGGFTGRAHLNFDLHNPDIEPNRPRFTGPMALLIDSRCISAGEGWASWFIANKRARVFGETTAGASSKRITYTLKNRKYKAQIPIRPRTGFLDRPIELYGLEPDVEVKQKAEDLAAGRDTVLEVAVQYLRSRSNPAGKPPQ